MSTYEWKKNLCCVAVYKTLEDDDGFDDFEEENWTFESAKDLKMGDLAYWLHTTNNTDIIEVTAHKKSRRFLKRMFKRYGFKKEKASMSSVEFMQAVAAIFADKNKTLCDLAETVDKYAKFSDE